MDHDDLVTSMQQAVDAQQGVLELDASHIHDSLHSAESLKDIVQTALPDSRVAFVLTPAMIQANYTELQFRDAYLEGMGVTDMWGTFCMVWHMASVLMRQSDFVYLANVAMMYKMSGTQFLSASRTTLFGKDMLKVLREGYVETMRLRQACMHSFPRAWTKYHAAAASAAAASRAFKQAASADKSK